MMLWRHKYKGNFFAILNSLHQGYLKIENNTVDINTEKLEKIAQILGIQLSELFSFDDKAVLSNFFNNTNNNQAVNNTILAVHELGESRELYEKLLADKDQIIADKNAEILYLRELVAKKV
jgi:hypothetical protein